MQRIQKRISSNNENIVMNMLVRNFVFLLTFGVASLLNAQSNPIITSWIQNPTGQTNPSYTSLECNVQSVYYTGTNSYISASSIPGYVIGPWQANPNSPSDQNFVCKFPLTPAVNNGTKTNTGLGVVGLWKNGVGIFNAKDGKYWNNTTQQFVNGITYNGWNRNALYFEGISFDSCKGHPAPGGVYHHHITPKCLYNQFDSTNHSPLLGFAWDGYPIYGPYTYTNTDGTGAIKRMTSSYVLTTTGTRNLGPSVTTYPRGSMCEDYVFTSGSGDLDQYNGRYGATPEYPEGTYAYFVTIQSDGTPSYPFVLGSQYYGVVTSTSTNNSIPQGAVKYDAPPLPVILFNFTVQLKDNDAYLTWRSESEINFSHFEIERSEDASNFNAIYTQKGLGNTLYTASDMNLPNGTYYYRLKLVNKDDSFSYSTIVTITVDDVTSLLIHNNPVVDVLTIQHQDAKNQRILRILDVNGREVLTETIPIGTTMFSIDIQTLYAGTYFMTISDQSHSISSKLIIHK